MFNALRFASGKSHWGFMLFVWLILSFVQFIWTLIVALNGAAVSTVLAYSSAASRRFRLVFLARSL